MGWFEIQKDSGIVLGDEALDETYYFLERLSELYGTTLNRKMSPTELSNMLELTLRVSGTRFLQLEDNTVESLTIKTAKKKEQKYQPGDLFIIPMDDYAFAFGRIMDVSKQGDLVEIFRYTATVPRYSAEIENSGRLFHPVYVSGYEVFRGWQWKIIFSDARYIPEDLDKLQFVIGVEGDFKLLQGNSQREVSDDEAKKFERKLFWRHDAIVSRIKKALG